MFCEFFRQAAKIFVNVFDWCFGFRRLFDKRRAVRSLLDVGEIAAQIGVGFNGFGFAQSVQVGAFAATETEVAQIEQIDLAAKRSTWGRVRLSRRWQCDRGRA